MSNTKYIEVDSKFRNRNEWPNPAQFEVPISQSGRKGAVDALDPLSLAATIASWQGNHFAGPRNATPWSQAIGIQVTVVNVAVAPDNLGASTGLTAVTVTGLPGQLSPIPDYYAGAVFNSRERPRIIGYTYLGGDRARFIMAIPFTSAGTGTPTPEIDDPTDIAGPAPNPGFFAPNIFVPGPIVSENFLANRIIYNETRDQSRPCGIYDDFTSLVPLITSGATNPTRTAGPLWTTPAVTATDWITSDTFSIRTQIPPVQIQLNGNPVDCPENHTSFNWPATGVAGPPTAVTAVVPQVGGFLQKLQMSRSGAASLAGVTNQFIMQLAVGDQPVANTGVNNFYQGTEIRITRGNCSGQIRLIVDYIAASGTILVEPGFTQAPAGGLGGDTYQLIWPHESRRIVKYVDLRATAVASTATTVDFPAVDNNGNAFSNVNGYYDNLYIVSNPGAIIRLITNYTVTTNAAGVITRRATLNAGVWPGGLTPFTITSGLVSPGFTSSISQSITALPTPPFNIFNRFPQYFCYLPFYQDSFNPFVYTGSLVSQQDMVCYEVTLLNVILPNIPLAVAYGSLIASYQYIYVQIQNVSAAGAGLKNIIYSNNPSSTKMTFRCPIKDVPKPVTSQFIKLDGNGMTQTIKFKPNDTLLFSVYMSTGEVFKTILFELFSPTEPDPFIQISAAFAIKRV